MNLTRKEQELRKWIVAGAVALTGICAYGADSSDTCSSIDLANPDPKAKIPLEKRPLSVMPIYFQDKTDSCYAHAAAQLADAWRFSHGDKDVNHLTDPLVVAVNEQTINQEPIDPLPKANGETAKMRRWEKGNVAASIKLGGPIDAFEAIRRYGSCPKSLISDRLSSTNPASKMDEQVEKLRQLVLKYKEWLALQNEPGTGSASLKLIESDPIPRKIAKDLCYWMRDEYELPEAKLPDIQWVESLLLLENPILALNEMLMHVCKESGKVKRVELPPLKLYWMRDFSKFGEKSPGDYARRLISAQLTANPAQPVGVNLCEKVFKEGDYKGFVAQGSPPQYEITKDCQQHVTVVVGRRRNPRSGKCQMIIRNSWGPHDCNRRKWPKEVNGRKKWGCIHGDYLVDEDALYKNLFSVDVYPENDPYSRAPEIAPKINAQRQSN